MPSTAISAQGTDLTINGTSIENIVDFSGFDGEAGEIEVTNLLSTAKEYIVGLIDNGNLSGTMHPDFSGTAAGQEALRAAGVSGATSAFVFTFRDLSTATFNAVVKNAQSIQGGVDAALAGSFSLKISGDVTFAPSP